MIMDFFFKALKSVYIYFYFKMKVKKVIVLPCKEKPGQL